MTQEHVKNLLKSINYPGFSRDIVSFGVVKGIQVSENQISVNLAIATQNKEHINAIKTDIEHVLSTETGITDIQVNFDVQPVKQAPTNGGATANSWSETCYCSRKWKRWCGEVNRSYQFGC